jgi:WD40 repeat protein
MNNVNKPVFLVVVACLIFLSIGCTTSKTLLFQLNGDTWKQHPDGTEPELLIKSSERPRWIPGNKTHFAYIERKPGTPWVKLWVAQEDGKNPLALTGFEIDSEFSWSPDGKWLAVSHTKDGLYQIYKIRADGSQLVRITNSSYTDKFPRWSPKGDKIAYVSNRGGHQQILVINTDGTGEKQLSVANHIGNDNSPDWSFDGKKLVYVAWRGAQPPPSRHPISYLEVVQVDTGLISRIVNFGLNTLPHYEDQYILYLSSQLQTKFTLHRYDIKTGKSISIDTFLNYYTGADPLTSSASHVFTTRQLTQSSPVSIFATQHYTGDTLKLSPGRQPDRW